VVERVVTQVVEKPVEKVVTKEVVVTATPAPAAAPAPKGPVTVEFIYSGADDVSSPNGKWIHDQIDQFQKENGLIKVKQTEMPWVGQREVLITRLVAGGAPSVTLSDDIMLSITQQAKAKSEAFKLIQYLQSEPKATERAIRPGRGVRADTAPPDRRPAGRGGARVSAPGGRR
jgi:ABC-type glycerol-3-phosphate transport system substrate-binding protein